MRDVAAAVGLHQTTVSLALRSHPSIPERTRARILKAAKRLGYRPDPLLSAFNFRRTSGHHAHSAPQIAFLCDFPSAAEADASPFHRECLAGAKEKASLSGVALERFLIGPGQLSPARLEQVLNTRNIGGVILCSFSLASRTLPLDWSRLSGLRIESFHVAPALDCITADHRQGTRLAIEQLRVLGYRRIGLALSREEDERLDGQHRIGYFVEHPPHATPDAIPPLVCDTVEGVPAARALQAWLRRHRVEAMITPTQPLARLLEQIRPDRNDRPALAMLPLQSDAASAGTAPSHRLIGARAVELLAVRLGVNQRGLPEHASVIYVPVEWRAGASAPDRSRFGPASFGQM